MTMLTLAKRDGEKVMFPGGSVRETGVTNYPSEFVVIDYSPENEKAGLYICPWIDVKEITIQ